MADEELSQDEIDALLKGVIGDIDAEPVSAPDKERVRLYNPATQHRVIRERLHALDIINERFARYFRMSVFNLIRRTADITVSSIRYQSYSDFSRNVPVPTSINLIVMKPLRGTAMVMFPPDLIFMVVDNLFGGDGRHLMKSEGREFTATEQGIIRRLLGLAMDAYQKAWGGVYPLEIDFVRSEMQARFANITSSPNEIVVNTTFHLEVENLASDFNIVMPYLMIEPLQSLLNRPLTDSNPEQERLWESRMAGELKEANIKITADFTQVRSSIGQVMSLKIGDILPIDLPDLVTARVDGVPVMRCEYGSLNGLRALRVKELIDHSLFTSKSPASGFVKGSTPAVKEIKDE